MITNNALNAAIQKAADMVANQIRDNLKSGNYPSGNDADRGNYKSIQDTIVIGTPKESGNSVSITITLGGADAPYAAAYEFGSGEHGTLGAKGKYKIEPKDASALAFENWNPNFIPWGSKKFIGMAGNKFLFRLVEHPGVEARPYIKPAVEAKKADIVKLLGQEFKASILVGQKKVEIIK